MMVGTCRKNRVGMPRDLFVERQRQGDLDFRRKGQLIVTRWFDKREVVNRRRLETALALRIAEFNQGSVACTKFLPCLGLKIGTQAKKFCAIHKKKRL